MTSETVSTFDALERIPKIAELVASQIRGRIVRRVLEPGSVLPTQSECMTQFGVSRETVRAAFRILETESLIEIRRGAGGGATVLTPNLGACARYIGLLLQFEGAPIADVCEARIALEPVCAAMVASRCDPGIIARLERCSADVAALLEDPVPRAGTWAQLTYRFSDLVLRGSGNNTLAVQGGLLHEIITNHHAFTIAERAGPEFFRQTSMSFKTLVRLVASGDRDGAQRHWTEHLQKAAAALLGMISEDPVMTGSSDCNPKVPVRS